MLSSEIATRVAWSFIGKPYIWGGDDPMRGFDCSGFAIEILQSAGRLPRVGDWTAADLKKKFPSVETPHEGCLVFWENAAHKITHVEYCLDSEYSIGSSGGDGDNTTVEQAIKDNAYIKARPFRTRPGLAGFNDPFALVV